jgi:hypothetical protein
MVSDSATDEIGSPHGGSVRLHVAEIARHATVVGIAGVVAGIFVGGVGGRVLMRVAALLAPDRATGALTESGNRVGDVTVGGTLVVILVTGFFVGAMGAVFFFIAEPWLSRFGRLRGLAFGVFLLLVAAGQSNTIEPMNPDFAIVANQVPVVAMFVVLFLLFGVLMAPLVSRVEERLPAIDPRRPIRSSVLYLGPAAFGFLLVLVLVSTYVQNDGIEATAGIRPDDPQVAVLVLLLIVGAATLLRWVSSSLRGEATQPVGAIGYAAFSLAALVGGYQVLADIADIV